MSPTAEAVPAYKDQAFRQHGVQNQVGLLHNTLKDSLNSIDTDITTQDVLEELAVTLCDKLMKTVDTSTPKTYCRNDPKSSISQAILDLIKEKRRHSGS